LALFNYRAARNFRNIWYHYPTKFDEFRAALSKTWPGMDILPPEISQDPPGKPKLHMFCPEDRIPREIFWAGFGFQVWCQMLTHIIQSNESALFLIDEPDIYLHSDLQRQLIALLRNMGPDILIATHSTEIITEAESDDIVLINKRRNSGQRIKHPSQLEKVFRVLGSNLNPILTQLAKTRRVVFVEGKDFQIIGKFAKKLGANKVGNRSEFAVVPVEGFNPERIRSLKSGMETTLGGSIAAAAILDMDYRSDGEVSEIAEECRSFCNLVVIHKCKEIENFLLVPAALDKASIQRINDQNRRSGYQVKYLSQAVDFLTALAAEKKSFVISRRLAERRRYERTHSPNLHEASVNELALNEFEARWKELNFQRAVMPGKEALSSFNENLQKEYGVSVTPTGIIDAMSSDDVPEDMKALVRQLSQFASAKVP
jgi:predicted ATP-dependent endonuclease of OLD family